MLNITQICWACQKIFITSRNLGLSWHIKWFLIHGRLMGFIHMPLFDSTNAMVKYINLIMCAERFTAIKNPFQYKLISRRWRVYAAVFGLALWAIAFKYTFYFIYSVDKIPCRLVNNNQYEYILYKFSKDFLYFEKCYTQKLRRFAQTWHFWYEKVIETITFHIIPLLLLLIMGIFTLRLLRNSRIQKSGNDLNISAEILNRREKAKRQTTKLVLGVAFNNITVSILQFIIMLLGRPEIYESIEMMLGVSMRRCTRQVLNLIVSVVFAFNPIIYFLFNKAMRQNVIKLFRRFRWRHKNKKYECIFWKAIFNGDILHSKVNGEGVLQNTLY